MQLNSTKHLIVVQDMETYDLNKKMVIDLHTCIQGEGKFAGAPHILIRTVGCNLTCQFSRTEICDTSYASWKPRKAKYSFNDVKNFIDSFSPTIRYVLITGGEPTLHPEFLTILCLYLRQKDMIITMETNGTRYINLPWLDLLTISPKLFSSRPIPGTIINNEFVKNYEVTEIQEMKHCARRINTENLRLLMDRYRDYIFKFVYTKEEDLEEIENLQQSLLISPHKIWLMPAGSTRKELEKHRVPTIMKCILKGYNYSDRLHIVAFGNKKGV